MLLYLKSRCSAYDKLESIGKLLDTGFLITGKYWRKPKPIARGICGKYWQP